MSTSLSAFLDVDAAPRDDDDDLDIDHNTHHNTTPRHLPRGMTPLICTTTTPPLTPSPPRLTASPSSSSSSSYMSHCTPASEPMRRSFASIGYVRAPLAAVDMARSPSSQGVDGNPFAGRESPLPPQRRASVRGEALELAYHPAATEPAEPESPPPSAALHDPHLHPHHLQTIPLRRRTTPRAFLAAQYDVSLHSSHARASARMCVQLRWLVSRAPEPVSELAVPPSTITCTRRTCGVCVVVVACCLLA